MNEKQYFQALKRELRGLSNEDRRSILDDYREHFRQSRVDGQSDEEIIQALGSPELLAEEAKDELGTTTFKESAAGNVVRISMAGFSLLLFNAIIVVGPYVGIVGAFIGLWAASASIFVSGLAATLSVPLEPILRIWLPIQPLAGVMPRVAFFFGGIALMALGAITVMGMTYLSRWFIRGTVRYANMTWRIITK